MHNTTPSSGGLGACILVLRVLPASLAPRSRALRRIWVVSRLRRRRRLPAAALWRRSTTEAAPAPARTSGLDRCGASLSGVRAGDGRVRRDRVALRHPPPSARRSQGHHQLRRSRRGRRPHLNIEIYRAGGEQVGASPARAPRSRRASPISIGNRHGRGGSARDQVRGILSLVDFTIHPVSGARRCLGFAHAFGEPPAQIAGTYLPARPGDGRPRRCSPARSTA